MSAERTKGAVKAALAVLAILFLVVSLIPYASSVRPSSAADYPRTVWGDLGRTGTVGGRVTWSSGENVTGAYVAIVNASNPGQAFFNTTTDQYGDFTITGANATFSSANHTGRDGTPATFDESLRTYQVYANVSFANGNYSEGYSGAFGIDADEGGVTVVSIVLYPGPAAISLKANRTSVDADGQDAMAVKAYGYDARGNPVLDGTSITLSVAAPGSWTPDNGSLGSPGLQSYVAAASGGNGSISTSFGWVPYHMGGNDSTILAYFTDDPSVNASLRIYFAPVTSSWTGYVVDSDGTGYGGLPVTLHVMGYDSGNSPYEIYNMTATTAASQPFAGLFAFDYIITLGTAYGYVDASARLTDNLTIYGKSDNYSMNWSRTSIGSVVLKVPPPDVIAVTADKDTILVGGERDRIVAQLFLNGLPYRRAGVAVTFTSDNDSVATLPLVKDNVTDSNGQAWIQLTSNDTFGKVNVTGTARIMYRQNLSDTCMVRVVDWGTVSGIVTDQNKVGIPNANVTLWNVKWNSTMGRWENTNMVSIPENPQLSNDGRSAAVGMYTFYRVPWDVYNVTAEKEGQHWYSIFVLGPWPSDVNAYANASLIPASEYGTATHNIVIPDSGAEHWPTSFFITPTPTPRASISSTPQPTPGFEALLALAAIALLTKGKRK